MRLAVAAALFVASCFGVAAAQEREPEAGLVALHQALLDASTDAVVLNVAAHPDDEASRTNTLLRRKYGMRVVTVYTTYGDGGQNAIGREIGPELAALRVRETLRAATLSDVEVRWLGMPDFGFSKTLDETLRVWDGEVLKQRLRKVLDEVDPDFVLTNHALGQGHGHHRATFWAIAELLQERAARKTYVPPMLSRSKVEEAQWIVDPAELEPARGETYARLAHRAWTQHVTQGPWGPHNPLQVGRDWWKVAVPGAGGAGSGEAEMPWTWVRGPRRVVPGIGPGGELLDRAALVKWARDRVMAPQGVDVIGVGSGDGSGAIDLGALLRHDRYLRGCEQRLLLALANVRVEVWLDGDEVAVGSDGKANVVVHGAERVQQIEVRCGDRIGTPVTQPVRALVFDGLPVSPAMSLPPSVEGAATAANAPTSPGPAGRFVATFPCAPPTGGPEPRFADVEVSFVFDGQPMRLVRHLPYTPVAPVELQWDREVVMVPKGRTVERVLSVGVHGHIGSETAAPVRLSLPPGIQAVPVPSRLSLSPEHSDARLLIRATIAADELTADAGIEVGFGEHSARIRVTAVDVAVPPGVRVALVRGPDDSTERALADLGVPFVSLDRDALAMARLDEFTTVLLDIRAYHHRPELAEVRDRLLQYVRAGGRVVAMYHKPGEWNERAGHPLLAPFPLHVADARVTEEDSPVVLLQPQHRVWTYPHTITAADFAGWVQERGLNFPDKWDPAWTPLLELKDSGEPKPSQGALLHTAYGRGDFVYCSLALYRQLRIGNAGAARLLVNLLAK